MTKKSTLQATEAINNIVSKIRDAEKDCAKAGYNFSAVLLRITEESLFLENK